MWGWRRGNGRALNVLGPAYRSRYCSNSIQISTDYIFDGNACYPYNEKDIPNTVFVYAKTELTGEKAVLAEAECALVIRTSWLYSHCR